jgi:O-antigen/teichoic acid export membrane protein
VVPGARHFVRSIFSFGAAQGLSWVGSAVLVVMLPQFLGDTNLGKLGSALGLTALAGLLANLGTSTFLLKEVARTPSRAAELTVNALALRLPVGVLAAASAAAVVTFSTHDFSKRVLVYVLCIGMFVDGANGIVQGTLLGLQRLRTVAAWPAATNLTYACLSTAALLTGGGVATVASASVVGQVAGLGLNVSALLRSLRLRARIDWRICRALLLGGLPFFVWQAALLIYGQVDAVLLSFLTKDAVVGWYVAAYRVVSMPIFMPTIVVTVIFSALSAASSQPQLFNPIARRAVHVVLLVSLPIALGIMLLPDRLISLLHYPPPFQHSIVPIILLAPSLPLIAVDMVIGTVLNSLDRQRQWALTGVAAAIINPLVNLAAIPFTQTMFGNGAIGAAAVTTATEVFMMAMGIRLLPRGVFDRTSVGRALRCLVAALAMAAVVLAVRDRPLAVPVLVGAVVYAAASVALRTLTADDVRQVARHLVERRPKSQIEAER